MAAEFDLTLLQKEIDEELRICINEDLDTSYSQYYSMLKYQMGWNQQNDGVNLGGKRVRPLLLLLATHAVSGDWRKSLPAAAALELMHNFSLIHDDIQDHSLLRHGRGTIWVKWGEAQAINVGDAMLTLSNLAVHRLSANFSTDIVVQVAKTLQNSCLQLTKGQYLDISFEDKPTLQVSHYWKMISGKTCSLLSAALEIGAFLGGADEHTCKKFRQTGQILGEAYQVQDDWLGIWGNDALTGKSIESDLISKKKTFPILTGIELDQAFAKKWVSKETITASDIQGLIQALNDDGIKKITEERFDSLYQQTIKELDSTECAGAAISPLKTIINQLLKRIQ